MSPAEDNAILDLDAIEARANAATDGPWDVHAHTHGADGCRCLSCDDPVVGWSVDHPRALDCDDLVAARSGDGELNEFGRRLASCSHGPLLSFEDATFAAHARTDIPALIAEIRRLQAAPEPTVQIHVDPDPPAIQAAIRDLRLNGPRPYRR